MAIQIKYIDERLFTVNGKQVILDMEGNWVAKSRLTSEELKSAKDYINALNSERKIKSPEIKKIEHKIKSLEKQPDDDAKFFLLNYLRKKLEKLKNEMV